MGEKHGDGQPTEDKKQRKGVQCFVCKKFRHVKAQCWFKTKEANVAEEPNEVEGEDLLFMASNEPTCEGYGTWLIESGCSHLMSGDRNLFENIDEKPPQVIRLGDGNTL